MTYDAGGRSCLLGKKIEVLQVITHLTLTTRCAIRQLGVKVFFMQMVFFVPPNQRRLAMLAAQTDTAPALIYGASGTGKSAIAKWIHNNGPRTGRIYLEINVGTVSISEAIRRTQGGSLVVHEIGEFPLSEQLVLLEFLRSHAVKDPKTSISTLANVRIIVTTSQALDGRAQSGLFNSELLERLNVFRIEMPPLVRRQDEFEDIALGIMAEIAHDQHKEYLRTIAPEAWTRLRTYNWPGNLRELRNVLKLAVFAAQGSELRLKDLPTFGPERIDFHATREQFERVYIQELLKTFDYELDRTCEMTRMDPQDVAR